jgi:serine/threonine protein kinase
MKEKCIGRRYVYDDENQLGGGGFAVVYRGRDKKNKRIVALKKLLPDKHPDEKENVIKRFEREAAILRTLQSPNIIQVYDYCKEGTDYYLVMEYADGGSWRDRIATSRNGLAVAETVDVGIAVCKALAATHTEKVIHRDVSPQNVLLIPVGGRGKFVPKLTDFGLARNPDFSSITKQGQPGTWPFMPREALEEGYEPDERRDVYGLGATLYYALTKRSSASSVYYLYYPNQLPSSSDSQNLSSIGIPQWLTEVIAKSLAPLSERYPSIDEMLKALEEGKEAESANSWNSPVVLRLEPKTVEQPVPLWHRPIVAGGIFSMAAAAIVVMILSIRACIGEAAVPPVSSPSVAFTSLPIASATNTATVIPVLLLQTPVPTVTPIAPSQTPALPTPTPTQTATPTEAPSPPPAPTMVPNVRPDLKTPSQGGTFKNPITFSWTGRLYGDQAYQITAYHDDDKGKRHYITNTLTSTLWIVNLPDDQAGEWKWQVSVVRGGNMLTSSIEQMFWAPIGEGPIVPTPR